MGNSFLGMKMVIVLLVFLIIPTFSISDHLVETNKSTTGNNSLAPPLLSSSLSITSPRLDSDLSPTNGFGKFLKSRKLVKEEMVTKVLDHLKVPKFMRSILRKSAKFGVCVADNFCGCVMLRAQPLIIGCFVETGLKCLKHALSDRVYGCTIGCGKSITKANHRLSAEAIGDYCHNKCMRSV